ncbi:MAG: TerB family tellurite resistance protein [Bacteroidales bacterium]|nr:TerB family tellurite resistance protein [Bacteroidales bacterium]
MGSAKWIVGFLGWVYGGPIGALIGYFLGSALDRGIEAARQLGPGPSGTSGTSGSSGRTYQRNTGGYTTGTEQRNSFFVSLLILSSAVIKADGRTLQPELDYVKNFIRQNFGIDAANQAMQFLSRLESQQVNIYSVGTQIADNMNYSQRLQLFDYLVRIAIADGEFSKSEKSVLESIGSALRLNSSDVASNIAMFYKETSESAYAVLEISPSATDDEVRTAYRRMAMKNHPDKVATLGPEVQKAAQAKFQKIQEAYETIKKERGMK